MRMLNRCAFREAELQEVCISTCQEVTSEKR
jgi:hypothetical protein